jgi:hypothetical protein
VYGVALKLPRFTIGVGDRFAQQAKAQLQACRLAELGGTLVCPIWNKSDREHKIIGSEPSQTRIEADRAVQALAWANPYFCDADHITLSNVDRFITPCDFFTIDVADKIGQLASQESLASFARSHRNHIGKVDVPGTEVFEISESLFHRTADKYLAAVQTAKVIYDKVKNEKGEGQFVTEISMDETAHPQTPAELLIILAAVAHHQIPIQTIAPKFSGRFNKGVEYIGDVQQFGQEVASHVAVIAYAVKHFGLPSNLKLSVHSGSDKFAIYEPIRQVLKDSAAGLHLKTAGTSWLEELIGLAECGGMYLAAAKKIYAEAYDQREQLVSPYSSVIDIDLAWLPEPAEVDLWTSEQYASALRHNRGNVSYNPHFRQLLHVGFKIAAKMGPHYLQLLSDCEKVVSTNVTANLFERHISPLFLGL